MNKQEMQEWFAERHVRLKKCDHRVISRYRMSLKKTPEEVALALTRSLPFLWDGEEPRSALKESAICYAAHLAHVGDAATRDATIAFVTAWMMHKNITAMFLLPYFRRQGHEIGVVGNYNHLLIQQLRRQWVLDRVKELQEL